MNINPCCPARVSALPQVGARPRQMNADGGDQAGFHPSNRDLFLADIGAEAAPVVPIPAPFLRVEPAPMMLDADSEVVGDLLLRDADFPDHFVRMQHPLDYTASPYPITEYIAHTNDRHTRLIARISWRKSENEFVPMSFVCDTGAPMGFYLSDSARAALDALGRVLEDDSSGQKYVIIPGIGKAAVEQTPAGHAPANIMGLRVLRRIGMVLDHQTGNFFFPNAPSAW